MSGPDLRSVLVGSIDFARVESSIYRTSVRKVYRKSKSIESLSKVYRKSIEHRSKVYRTSVESLSKLLSKIYRKPIETSIESLSKVCRTSIGKSIETSIESLSKTCRISIESPPKFYRKSIESLSKLLSKVYRKSIESLSKVDRKVYRNFYRTSISGFAWIPMELQTLKNHRWTIMPWTPACFFCTAS